MTGLYVIYTQSGNEKKVMELLYGSGIVNRPDNYNESSIIASPHQELLFAPTSTFEKTISVRRFGKGLKDDANKANEKKIFHDIRYIYPGYVFINTDKPVDFYYRVTKPNSVFGIFGMNLKVLKNHISPKDIVQNTTSIAYVNNKNIISEEPEAEWFKNHIAQLSPKEESGVLGLCNLKRTEDGSIVRVGDSWLDTIGDDPFHIRKSYAVKYVRKFKNDGKVVETQKNEKAADGKWHMSSSGGMIGSRLVITDGPLMGREGDIVYVNRHKKFVRMRTVFMGATTEITLPLEITEVIEE